MSKLSTAPDQQISHKDSLSYWESIPGNVNGMLGGFPEVSVIDLSGSKSFIRKLQIKSRNTEPFGRGVDCGMQQNEKKDVGADHIEYQELVLAESPRDS